jgi:hypothetical protein
MNDPAHNGIFVCCADLQSMDTKVVGQVRTLFWKPRHQQQPGSGEGMERVRQKITMRVIERLLLHLTRNIVMLLETGLSGNKGVGMGVLFSGSWWNVLNNDLTVGVIVFDGLEWVLAWW